MTLGQGFAEGEPARLEHLSTCQGEMFLLPFWLQHGPNAVETQGLQYLRDWFCAYARTWQLTQDRNEGRPGAEQALAAANQVWRDAWPDQPVFQSGGSLAAERFGLQ